MRVKILFIDEDAVSPVIGVILMVAITVILAAVIGAFVLDLGGSEESAPQASWEYDYQDNDDGWGDPNDAITVHHRGGDEISRDTVTFAVEGTAVTDTNDYQFDTAPNPQITAGDQIVISGDNTALQSGDSIQVTWDSSSGDSSSVIAETTI